MNGEGTQIVASLRTVRDFHAEVAKLLMAATSTMNNHNWLVPSRSIACGSNSSKAVGYARYWLVEDAFQFYRNDTDTSRLAYISIVLDDVQKPAKVKVPFISAGCIRFALGGPGANGELIYSWCRLALEEVTEVQLDGRWRSVSVQQIDKTGKYQMEEARTMSRPLLEIECESDLKSLIVTPLLDLLSGNEPQS